LAWKKRLKKPIQPKNKKVEKELKELGYRNVINNYIVGGGGGLNLMKPENLDFSAQNKEKQLEMLLRYIKIKAKDNVYKKEGNRYIGIYFNCGKDLISHRFKELIALGFLEELKNMDRYYRIKE
jgi:hypothetical protein